MPQVPSPQDASSTPPRVDATISERRPLVQQNLIYRIRIHGSGNLREASPDLPQLDGVVFRQLGRPASFSSAQGADAGLVTEYTYLVIPLVAGTLEIPPPRVSGRYANGRAFKATGKRGITLYVQPAVSGVTPWLPLYDLRMEARMSNQQHAKAGEPITLEITTSAVGALGSQLPPVADQLKSDDFYIYPGESSTTGRVSSNGLDLIGSRTERFTLVPRYGGRLTLPAITIQWWNLRTGKPATVSVPMRQLRVAGPVNKHPAEDHRNGGFGVYFWLPLGLAALVMIFAWLKVIFGRGGPLLPRFPSLKSSEKRSAQLLAPLRKTAQHLSPRRHLHRLRTWIGRRLPVSWKLWYCLRAVDREKDPAAWEHALRILAAKHLSAAANASLKELATVITACHPGANEPEVKRLLAALERHNYGSHPIKDFEAWKRAFQAQIKPRLFPIRLRRCDARPNTQGLPPLNPSA